MTKIHTHYDNLKVARNAPAEVIKASYRALSMKFHPDVNSSEEASRIMKILNNSYDVLADSEKRKIYDYQIHLAENRMESSESEGSYRPRQEDFQRTQNRKENFKSLNVFSWIFIFMGRNPRLALFVIVFGVGWLMSLSRDTGSSPSSYVSSQKMNADNIRSKRAEEQNYKYEKPVAAPNGVSWPAKSGYLSGYKKLNRKGKSTIQIENFENDNDFYVKLVDSTKEKTVAVRHALIKGGDEFIFANISPGKYKLMYMDLDSGSLTKSQDFEVQEIVEEDRIRVSSMKITLYKVRNGNFKSEGIDLDEFMNADTISENKTPLDLNPNDKDMRI